MSRFSDFFFFSRRPKNKPRRSIYLAEFGKSAKFHKNHCKFMDVWHPKQGNFCKEMYTSARYKNCQVLSPMFPCLRPILTKLRIFAKFGLVNRLMEVGFSREKYEKFSIFHDVQNKTKIKQLTLLICITL